MGSAALNHAASDDGSHGEGDARAAAAAAEMDAADEEQLGKDRQGVLVFNTEVCAGAGGGACCAVRACVWWWGLWL